MDYTTWQLVFDTDDEGPISRGDMEPTTYRIYCFSTHEPIDALPMYVLAHAYSRAWRFLRGTDPRGKHVLGGLDLVIEFSTATS